MAFNESTPLNLRINPNVKEAPRITAERESRNINNMVGVLIRVYSAQYNINVVNSAQTSSYKGNN